MHNTRIRVGNAPCSWGTIEVEGMESTGVPYAQMLDELVATGYTGTELGDWGFMPTDAGALTGELSRRSLTMLGAFVPFAFKFQHAHEAGVRRALDTARLLAAVSHVGDASTKPFLVLADANGMDPARTANAGRITGSLQLDAASWKVFSAGVDQIAHIVFEETGLRTVFHHHGAGFVETPREIEQLLDQTNPDRVGLVFDTGHYALGGGDVSEGLARFWERIWYVHFKDYDRSVAERAREESWGYGPQIENGIFCELGQGAVPFESIALDLASRSYAGWICVEQDMLPGMGDPKDSAHRNREYLKQLGL